MNRKLKIGLVLAVVILGALLYLRPSGNRKTKIEPSQTAMPLEETASRPGTANTNDDTNKKTRPDHQTAKKDADSNASEPQSMQEIKKIDRAKRQETNATSDSQNSNTSLSNSLELPRSASPSLGVQNQTGKNVEIKTDPAAIVSRVSRDKPQQSSGTSISQTKSETNKQMAVVSPSLTAKPTQNNTAPGTPSSENAKPSVTPIPGITQNLADDVIVTDIRLKGGEGEDFVTVKLTRPAPVGLVKGKIWIIAEYVQRGTPGIMFMPSHNELKVTVDGQAKYPDNGLEFSMGQTVEKKLTVRRPGFEGEELVAIRVGINYGQNQVTHVARTTVKQIKKKNATTKRVKVDE